MKITEVFKAESNEERREAVTNLMIQLENNKHKQAETPNKPKAGSFSV